MLVEINYSKSFNNFVSLEKNSRKNVHAEFTKSPVVLCIKNAVKNMVKIQKDTKEHLVSILV